MLTFIFIFDPLHVQIKVGLTVSASWFKTDQPQIQKWTTIRKYINLLEAKCVIFITVKTIKTSTACASVVYSIVILK